MAQPWRAHYENEAPPHLSYPRIPLHRLLADTAQRYPEHPAIHLVLQYLGPLSLGCRLNYRQLLAEVDGFAAALAALGVRKGDRVALMLPNLPQFVIAFYGALKLGAVVVNTNPQYKAREIEHQFGESGAETVVMLRSLYPRLREVQARTAVKHVILTDPTDYVPASMKELAERWLTQAGPAAEAPEGDGIYRFRPLIGEHPEAPPAVSVEPEDLALLQYTGGTTGVPRAAMLTHGNLVANTLQFRSWLTPLEEGKDRFLCALPLFHVYGMTTAMNVGIACGGELVLLASPRPIEFVMEVIQKERITIYPGAPIMYIGIIHHPDVANYDLRSVKACISGAAPLPMDVQLAFGEITGGRLVEGYGLTEAAPVTHCNPVLGERRAGSIGLPIADVEARIVDYETLQDRPAGEIGELWVRGPQVMRGYWQAPDETAKAITPDGWLRTGDIARMDADGYFYIVDRLKDIIISAGFNIVPREVEEVLFEHPKVQEAVVVGIPDAYRGEVVKAYLVLKAGETATAQEIIAFCEQQMAGYKVPRQVEFRTELPKTAVGKVLRRSLAEEEQRKRGARGD